jgi:hypothetical protein
MENWCRVRRRRLPGAAVLPAPPFPRAAVRPTLLLRFVTHSMEFRAH